MKREYELSVVIRVDPNEQVIRDSVNEVQGWVEADGMGEVKKADHWGRRRLAYEVDGQREGYYVIMNVDIDTEHLPEVERNLKLSSTVLRYLLVRPD